MTQTNRNEEVLAMVTWKGKINLVYVHQALLIFDLLDWARANASNQLLLADLALKQGYFAASGQHAAESAVWSRWLGDPSQPLKGHPMVGVRQTIAPLMIGAEKYDNYVRALIEHSTIKRAYNHRDISAVEVVVTEDRTKYISERCEMLMSDFSSVVVDPDRMGDIVAQEMLRMAGALSDGE